VRAATEAATPKPAVTPAPTLPANELLGDLLMERGQPGAALAAYRKSLDAYPRRFNSLLGAARAAHALGDAEATRQACKELLTVAATTSRRESLADVRAWLAQAR